MDKWLAVERRATALVEIIRKTEESGSEMSANAIKQAEILYAVLKRALPDKDYLK